MRYNYKKIRGGKIMREPSKENISLVLRGFEGFYQFMTGTKTVDLQQFVSFMEPIFKTAGYRNAEQPPRELTWGGAIF